MKYLKFSSDQTQNIINGQYTKTWRLFDDKNLNVDDKLMLVDSTTNKPFGSAIINKIVIKRLKDLDNEDMQGHKPYATLEDIISDFNKIYFKKVDKETIIKIIYLQYNPDINSKFVVSRPQVKEVKIFTDGGSRGNPGPSACAYVITDMQGNVVKSDGIYLGITTNNQAEYQAVRIALIGSQDLGARVAHFYLDSLLVVNQMKGIYKIRNRDLWPIHQEIKELIKRFKAVDFAHIPREVNKEADQKVNDILDGVNKSGLKSDLV